MEIAIVSDELTPDFEQSVETAGEWGIRLFELRMLSTGRVPGISDAERRDLHRIIDEYGVRITALSPGLFKYFVDDAGRLQADMEDMLPRTLDLAAELGVSSVIVFGFQRRDRSSIEEEELVLQSLREAAAIAKASQQDLLIENEPGYWFDTGINTARMIERIDRPNLFANWDPCNAYLGPGQEAPFPDGYHAVKRFIRNVHVKDTIEGSLVRCVPVGEGVIDWKGQMEALVRDGLVGHITIETHCEPRISNSRRNMEMVRTLLAMPEGLEP